MKKLMMIVAMCSVQAYADGWGRSATALPSEPASEQAAFHLNPTIGIAEMGIRATGLNSDYGTGVSIGALGEFGGTIAFQTGLLYNQFGGKSSSGDDQIVNLDYLSIPLFLKYNAMGSADRSLYVRAGFMPGFLVSKDAQYSSGFSTNDLTVKSFDLPVVIGFGGAIPVAPRVAITLGADWVHSLTSIQDNANGEAHNDGFLLTTGATIAM